MNTKFSKHKVEVFSAECQLCKTTVNNLKKIKQRPGVDFVVHKASECTDGSCCRLAASYGIYAVPSLVVDEKLVKVGVIKDSKEIEQYLS